MSTPETHDNSKPPLADAIGSATCGDTDNGGYPIRQMVCDRRRGHEGWHNESATGSSWPPKAKKRVVFKFDEAPTADNSPPPWKTIAVATSKGTVLVPDLTQNTERSHGAENL